MRWGLGCLNPLNQTNLGVAETLFEPYMIPFLKSQVKTSMIDFFFLFPLLALSLFLHPTTGDSCLGKNIGIPILNTITRSQRVGTTDSKWQGWSKDFFGFEIFDFGILGGKKILVFFWVAWFWVFKTILRFVIVPAYPGHIVPLEIFMARKFGMGFLGG